MQLSSLKSSDTNHEKCIIHNLPIVIDDKIRSQKFCRLCLVDFVEGDELKSKYRSTLLQSIEMMLSQIDDLTNKIEKTQNYAEDRFKKITNHSDEAFGAIIAAISSEREAYRSQLHKKKTDIQTILGESNKSMDELKENVHNLKDLIIKPLSGVAVDLVSIEQEAITIKKILTNEEIKIDSLQLNIAESDIVADFSEDRINSFLNSCLKLNMTNRNMNESFEQYSRKLQTEIENPIDSVSDEYEPVLFKFVWNTRQADCYQILKGVFCTLTIPSVTSRDSEVNNSSFAIPKFSKSIITEFNRVYLIGGAKLDTMSSLKYTFEFELETLKLTKRSNMKFGRYHHATVYLNGFIYTSGGVNKPIALNSVERYDISCDTWTEIARMCYPRSCHSLCVFSEILIYAIFGQVSIDTIANTIERYEISNNAWTVLNIALPKWIRNTKHMGSYIISNNEIIIFGGADATNNQFYTDSYTFNPLSGEFKKTDKIRNLTIFRNQPVCYKGRIYAFGVDNYVHVFDVKTKKWSYIYDKLS